MCHTYKSHIQVTHMTHTFFLDGYCSTVLGLLDWFEVDLGFTELHSLVGPFFTLTHIKRPTKETCNFSTGLR